ncbi:hypothetical protein TNCV_1208791 [Trichonephila clavipes]|nr:hypothetical protein TNCV_1208791 [Trichonephila clavipes]
MTTKVALLSKQMAPQTLQLADAMSGRLRRGQYERKLCSISRLWMLMVATRVRFTRLRVDKDESCTVTAGMTINVSFRSLVALS